VAKLLDEVGFHLHEKEDDSIQHCPACDQEISDHAVLCVYCGYNLETGKFVKGMGGGPGAGQKAEGHEGAALMLLKKAERAITQDKDEERKMRTQGMPLWMIITILSIIASFTVGMSVLPRDQAFLVSGYVWMSVCGALAIVYWFRLVVIAFQESVSHGLMFQFVPFYSLYYVVKRWDDCGKLFMTHVILSLLVIPGSLLVLVSPKLKSEPAQEVTLAGSQPPAVMPAPLAPRTGTQAGC
jgi:heme/copper-type cytochrome/quinol oxidase subunit 3